MVVMKRGDPLTPEEKQIFDLIQNDKSVEALNIINNKGIRIDCLDENGATPLQQAAFKGNTELCRVLLEKGADVNSNEHEHSYTALMFGALSGNADVCKLLLDAGAKTYMTNKVHRTASEMAAFVGQHHCVSVINNYLSLEDVERIIHPKGIDSKERIPMKFAKEIHQLVRSYNIHPIKTIKFLQTNIELLDHRKPFATILEELFDLQMKQKETNEVMALKLWMFVFVVKETFKFIEQKKNECSKAPNDLLILYAKHLLATDSDTNFPKNLELLVRQGIKTFPYHQSVLFQTLVKGVSQTTFGNEPSALSYLHQALLGQRMMMDETFCSACGDPARKKRCAACKMTNYCSSECQKLHWFSHKRWCSSLALKHDIMREQRDANETNETEGGDDSDAKKAAEGPSDAISMTQIEADCGSD